MKLGKLTQIAVVSTLSIFAGAQAFAGSSQTNLPVTATVSSSCSVNAANMDFGQYDANSPTADDASANVGVLCTKDTAFTIALNKGNNSTTYSQRDLKRNGSSDLLAYNLYTTDARSTVWGNGDAGTGTEAGTSQGSTINKTVYGRIPAGQTSATGGDYTDTVSVDVTYQ